MARAASGLLRAARNDGRRLLATVVVVGPKCLHRLCEQRGAIQARVCGVRRMAAQVAFAASGLLRFARNDGRRLLATMGGVGPKCLRRHCERREAIQARVSGVSRMAAQVPCAASGLRRHCEQHEAIKAGVCGISRMAAQVACAASGLLGFARKDGADGSRWRSFCNCWLVVVRGAAD